MNFPFSQVAGYAELQRKIIDRTTVMIGEAINNNDVTMLEALRDDCAMGFDFAIEVIQGRFSYEVWLEGSTAVNNNCKMTKLDTTGELQQIISTLDQLDARAYYESDVVKIFDTDLDVMTQGRITMYDDLTEIIEHARNA